MGLIFLVAILYLAGQAMVAWGLMNAAGYAVTHGMISSVSAFGYADAWAVSWRFTLPITIFAFILFLIRVVLEEM